MNLRTLMIAAGVGILALAHSGAANAQAGRVIGNAVKCAPGLPLPGCQNSTDKAINKAMKGGGTAGQKIQDKQMRDANRDAARIRNKKY